MKISLIILLSVLCACGGKHSGADYGKTTEADLLATKGPPQKEEKLLTKNSKMLIYPGNEKYQVQNGVVTHGLKDPKDDQKLVLYWRHKFKDCNVVDRTVSAAKGHAQAEKQLSCNEMGMTVFYHEGSPYVSRIIEHEKK